MIQPIYDDIGQVYACRVHDMVLDLICNLSHEAKFAKLLDGTGDSMSSQSNVRHLSLQDGNADHQATPLINFTRSITIFPSVVSIMPPLSRFEVLGVLDLSGCNLGGNSCLQLNLKDVGHLIQLRYLGLAGTGISELPAEIGNLRFLEVLELGRNELLPLSSTICKLRRLIYLNVYFCTVVPAGVLQNLTSIEELNGIVVSLNIIAQELSNLARLRELMIHFKDGSLALYEGFVKSLCNLHRIESLSINCNSGETSLELMDLLGEHWVPPVQLREFVSEMPSKLSALRGWIKRNPSHLSNLSMFILYKVMEVQQEDVEIIEGLLSLRRLYVGSLQFLEVLDLGNNYELGELPSTVCNLRRLIYLSVYPSKVVPAGVLQNLTSIEVLRRIGVSLNIIAQELGNLARLRELRICFEDGSLDLYEGFVKSLCNLHQIKSLSIDCNSGETSVELMDLLGERWVPPVHLREFASWMASQLSALRGWIKRDPSHLSNLSRLILVKVKEVQQEDVEIIGGLLSLRYLYIKSTHQTQRLLVICADGFRCMVDFDLNCRSATQIMFEPGALPRAEAVGFSLGVQVAKEDGNSGFDLGLQGNLLSLRQRVFLRIYCGGARVGEAKEAEAVVRHALDAHPNHPKIYINMYPDIAEGAHDDDLCEDEEED